MHLSHLNRDIQTQPSSTSPSEGQSPTAVRYRNGNQRRFSMEVITVVVQCGESQSDGRNDANGILEDWTLKLQYSTTVLEHSLRCRLN